MLKSITMHMICCCRDWKFYKMVFWWVCGGVCELRSLRTIPKGCSKINKSKKFLEFNVNNFIPKTQNSLTKSSKIPSGKGNKSQQKPFKIQNPGKNVSKYMLN